MMTDRVEHWLERADRALRAARRDLDDGDAESAADHAYYAMFYAASACLERDGLRFRKHSATHAAFGARFARTSLLDPTLHRWLLQAFLLRTTATYDIDQVIAREDAETALSRAVLFREAVAGFLAET
jgi:uncharacterized protein (UPF0332 family)